jgi:hypothetical protein
VLGRLHDVPLIHDYIFLLVLHNDVLIDHLHRIELPILLETAQINLRKTSRADQLDDLEAIKSQPLPLVDASLSMGCLEVQRLAVEELSREMTLHEEVVEGDLNWHCSEVADFGVLLLELP